MKSKKIVKIILLTVVIIIITATFTFFYGNWMKQIPLIEKGRFENEITVPEGWSVWQIGEMLAKDKRVKNIKDEQEFWFRYQDTEGFLFPDTYRIFQDAGAEEIILKMKSNFLGRINKLEEVQELNNGREFSNFEEAASNKILREKIIIASIVEREAKKEEDRAKIAGIYYNRLNNGMELEADPTVQYGRDRLFLEKNPSANLSSNDFESWEPINKNDYQSVKSPYNTYLFSGLPPGPICNPGLASIKAALNPEKHDFYYFFNLRDGSAIYSRTKEEHDKNKIKYSMER